jgi:hypothetical protein
MLTNESLRLSDEQLATYNEWGAQRVKAHFDEECLESLDVSLVFTFSILGRSVEAWVGSSTTHKLVLESAH